MTDFSSQRVETAHQKTVIVLYFNAVTTVEVCPQVKATRKSIVENLLNSPIKIYDYYNQRELSAATTMAFGDVFWFFP